MSLNPVKVDGYQEKDKLSAAFEMTAEHFCTFCRTLETEEIQLLQEIYQALERNHQKEESVSLDNSQTLNQSKRGSTSLGPIIPEVSIGTLGRFLKFQWNTKRLLSISCIQRCM